MRQTALAGKLSLSVSQLNEYVRRVLQLDPMLHAIEVKGEISNLKYHQSGILFFTLKDEGAAISCMMSETDALRLQTEPFEGMRAVVSGSVGLYARGGQYQLIATGLQADGVGVLYERLLALKTKLAAEGLFDPRSKKPIPSFCPTIGVVSSPTGAVIHDILNVSLRRNPQTQLLLCPVRVQGIGAAQEVAHAIRLMDCLPEVGVIIVARGGGSMEDLWTFNEECVVRAVAACRKPVVSAIGHETDITLCDLAADLRAPTPSAAAECVVAQRDRLYEQIARARQALRDAMLSRLDEQERELKRMKERLSACHPGECLEREQKRLEWQREQLRQSMRRMIHDAAQKLQAKQHELELLSPYHVLARGYALVMREGLPVETAGQLRDAEKVTLRFADGSISARIIGEKEEEAN